MQEYCFTRETDAFSDVVKNTWYSGYVGWANSTGIVESFEDGTFRPDVQITSEEAAASVSRYIEYVKVILNDTDESPEIFKDEETISDWAATHVDRVSLAGVIVGGEKENFNPSASLTRAESAGMFTRLHKMIKEAETAAGVISAWDVINTPELFYSNMTSELETLGEYPEIKLTPYGTHKAPWYFGI